CVLCFFQDVIDTFRDLPTTQQIHTLGSEIGPNPIYQIDWHGQPLLLVHPGVGAPLAGAFLEELIALGLRNFIACGGCGVLDGHRLPPGAVMLPTAAIRDEGTSYHYLPPSRLVYADKTALHALETTLQHHHIPYEQGLTWTTDAPYRETRPKMVRRVAEGCLTVEMEAAAFFAIAQYRQVTLGQLLYGGDDLSGDQWDSRDWHGNHTARHKLLTLAAEACLRLP
ncbi:MAG TPA: nucleoside phosphorylase, partial [Anaerolineae bacterium]|nr:nucleoside phosphorylase [Anaerolineae bacterium]